MGYKYIRDLPDRPFQVVVHDHVRSELPPDPFFFASTLDPPDHLLFVVPSGSQAMSLFLSRRREKKDEDRVGKPCLHLCGALEIDLEHDIGARRVLREGRAVEVA